MKKKENINHFRELQQYLLDLGLHPSNYRIKITTVEDTNYFFDLIYFDSDYHPEFAEKPERKFYVDLENEIIERMNFQPDFDLEWFIDNCIKESDIESYQLYVIEDGQENYLFCSSSYEDFKRKMNIRFPEQSLNFLRMENLRKCLED